MAEKKLFLLDAYALIFRAYYAFIRNPRVNSKGLNTSAMFGFTNALQEVLDKHKPTHIAVCFDHKSVTNRAQEHDFYKANRQETPEDIRTSEPYIRKIIEGYNIPIYEAEGFEADDVIGTMAKMAERAGFQVYMMTPDKDFMQLVSENIFMYKPARSGKPPEVIGVKEVLEKFGLENPEQFIDILGMMGDAVDNIPGIPGVGEKTAIKLIAQFGSIENMYKNLDQIKGKLKEKIEANEESAYISKKLATIVLDAPVKFEPEKLVVEKYDREKLAAIFADLEFRTLGRRILGEEYNTNQPTKSSPQLDLFGVPAPIAEKGEGKTREEIPHDYKLVDTDEARADLLNNLQKQTLVAFDTETTGLDSLNTEIVGMSFSWKKHEGCYVPCPADQKEAKAIVQFFKPFFENEKIEKIGHNLKFDMQVLGLYDVDVKGLLYDTMVAHYVAESEMRHKMDILAETYLGYTPVPIEDLIGKRGKNQKTMRDVPVEKVVEYASEDADITFQLKEITDKLIEEKEAGKLLKEIELPLVNVLCDMECEGVNLDVGFLQNYSEELEKELVVLRSSIYEAAGTEFNLDSPKQVGQVLFVKMEIPYSGKKTKTGQFSTNEETLSRLSEENEIIGSILNYRELTKLKSTYVDALPKLINPRTNRLHTTFNQTIAATGRLSSINPNLQNIPIRTERGRRIRKAFIPRDENHVLMAADYSQIELRLIAAITKDEGMMSAFINNEDIHTATAAKVFGVNQEEVDRDMRRKAKAVNFGIAYGQSAFGLAQTLKIARKEAKEIIDNYFEQYPGIKNYMSKTVEFAREHGFVETLLGRRRYLRDINSRNHTVRSQAERNAINSPIQGSAADMIKIAMINVDKAMQKAKLKSKMILQVHDELVFDVHKPELEELKELVEREMKDALPNIEVPIKVEAGVGQNWLEAH
ncbi:MAG: DNA polymerase I [Saprospiraceae bacterium]